MKSTIAEWKLERVAFETSPGQQGRSPEAQAKCTFAVNVFYFMNIAVTACQGCFYEVPLVAFKRETDSSMASSAFLPNGLVRKSEQPHRTHCSRNSGKA